MNIEIFAMLNMETDLIHMLDTIHGLAYLKVMKYQLVSFLWNDKYFNKFFSKTIEFCNLFILIMFYMIETPFWEFTLQGVCVEGEEDNSTKTQIECQSICERNIDCVGISYYDTEYDRPFSNCIICNKPNLNQTSRYTFYNKPGNEEYRGLKVSS